ncbi:patatin-like phospholipase family protein [Pseudahrensia aquimaris]|uniref:Patatin-like phospholipase family protein n=1 Tax=Pseudahrensia aquimaris TaxID=744461 RepID=A0ABW3FFH3_9HYPH
MTDTPTAPAAPLQQDTRRGIALALGGGAARGWSHIGVIRALDEAKIPIKMIAGTSIGAMVGGCYLAGKLDELEDFARNLTPRRIIGFLDLSLRGSGLISGVKLAERMEHHIGLVRIEDLDRPLVCVATEISTGHEIWLTQGPLIDAMRASYALPGIFEPVKLNGRTLVDGALVNPVPVPVCRAFEADAVVAVNLSSDIYGRGTVVRDGHSQPSDKGKAFSNDLADHGIGKGPFARVGKAMGISGVMVEAYNIIQDRIARSRLAGDPPDMSIIPAVSSIGLAEFHRADEAIEAGYRAAQFEIDRLLELANSHPA